MNSGKATSNKIAVKEKRIPYYYKPEEMSYGEWQIGLRRQFGREQEFVMTNLGGHPVWTDFEVGNSKSKARYKVAIRSADIGMNFCESAFEDGDVG